MRARVAFRAFLAEAADFFAVLIRPRATAAGCFDMTMGSIARKSGLDKPPIVR
jgi:hypothetical protein